MTMPRETIKMPPVRQEAKRILYDRNGNEILRLGVEEYEIIAPDGSRTIHKIKGRIRLVSGSICSFADIAAENRR